MFRRSYVSSLKLPNDFPRLEKQYKDKETEFIYSDEMFIP